MQLQASPNIGMLKHIPIVNKPLAILSNDIQLFFFSIDIKKRIAEYDFIVGGSPFTQLMWIATSWI